jgi:ferredoxin
VLHLNIRRVWIERAECLGHTLCIPEAPGLIEFDDNGGVAVVREASLKRTQSELKILLEASAVCPMRAFRIEIDDGFAFTLPGNEDVRKAIREGRYSWA